MGNPRLYVALALQSWRIFISISFALLAPLLLAALYLMPPGDEAPAWSLDVALVEDDGPMPPELLANLNELASLNIVRAGRRQAQEQLQQGEVGATVEYSHIPESGSAGILVTSLPQWTDLLSDAMTAAISMVNAPLDEVGYEVRIDKMQADRDRSAALAWFAPGVVVFALANLGFLTAGSNVTLKRQDGSMLLYAITPISARAYFVADISVMAAIGLAQGALLFSLFLLFSDFTIKGSLFAVVFIVLLTALAFAGMGMLVAGALPRAQIGFAVTPFLNVFVIMLGNVLWPAIEIEWLRPLVLALPSTYAADALRQIIGGTAGLFPLWLDATVLLGVIVLTVSASSKLFRFDAGGR